MTHLRTTSLALRDRIQARRSRQNDYQSKASFYWFYFSTPLNPLHHSLQSFYSKKNQFKGASEPRKDNVHISHLIGKLINMLSGCLVLKFTPLQDLRAVERVDRFFGKTFLYDHMTSEVRALDSLGFIFFVIIWQYFLIKNNLVFIL